MLDHAGAWGADGAEHHQKEQHIVLLLLSTIAESTLTMQVPEVQRARRHQRKELQQQEARQAQREAACEQPQYQQMVSANTSAT